MKDDNKKFWKIKVLSEMTDEEMESLCDRCGLCCLQKLEYEDTGEIEITAVACRHLDINECVCRIYNTRSISSENCLQITPENIMDLKWLPETCAYRRIAKGRDLEWWHHLVSGSYETVHDAGISVRNKAVPGRYVHPDDVEAYIL